MEYYLKTNFWAFGKGRLFGDQLEELLGSAKMQFFFFRYLLQCRWRFVAREEKDSFSHVQRKNTICEIVFGQDIDSVNSDCQFGRSFDIAQ